MKKTHQSKGGRHQRGGQTITAALLDRQPSMERHLDGLFSLAPHRFSRPAESAALRLGSLGELVDDLDLSILPPDIRQSVPKRRLSYIGGRLCAEYSLRRLGLKNAAISRHQSGEPSWPAGVVGSISHSNGMAYAAVCTKYGRFSIGIDSEPIVEADVLKDIREVCCTDRENSNLFCNHDPNLIGTLIFSAKESLFKAIHSVVRRIVEFNEVEVVSIDWVRRELHVHPVFDGDSSRCIPQCRALFRIEEKTIHTSVAFDTSESKEQLIQVMDTAS